MPPVVKIVLSCAASLLISGLIASVTERRLCGALNRWLCAWPQRLGFGAARPA